MFKPVTVAVCLLGLSACTRGDEPAGAVPANFPKHGGEGGDAAAQTKIGRISSSGGERLVLDLSRLPPLGTDVTVGSCWSVPDADLPIGRAVCASGGSKTTAIFVANASVTCQSNSEFVTLPANKSLNFDACEAYDIYLDAFTPALSVTVQK